MNYNTKTNYYAKRCELIKKVRHYMIEHPGSTSLEIREATGYGASCVQDVGLAYWKRNKENDRVEWFAKPGLSRPWLDEKDRE